MSEENNPAVVEFGSLGEKGRQDPHLEAIGRKKERDSPKAIKARWEKKWR
jgi:hypothetical protein